MIGKAVKKGAAIAFSAGVSAGIVGHLAYRELAEKLPSEAKITACANALGNFSKQDIIPPYECRFFHFPFTNQVVEDLSQSDEFINQAVYELPSGAEFSRTENIHRAEQKAHQDSLNLRITLGSAAVGALGAELFYGLSRIQNGEYIMRIIGHGEWERWS